MGCQNSAISPNMTEVKDRINNRDCVIKLLDPLGLEWYIYICMYSYLNCITQFLPSLIFLSLFLLLRFIKNLYVC